METTKEKRRQELVLAAFNQIAPVLGAKDILDDPMGSGAHASGVRGARRLTSQR